MRPLLLQLTTLTPWLEAELARRFEVQRWSDLADPHDWLARAGAEVRAVVTGGHVGCADEIMRALPALQIIAINGVGYDRVNLELARQRGVRVTNTPDVLTDDVADLAIGLIIALLRGVARGDATVRAGLWPQTKPQLGRKVSGLRYGILGLGRIGSAIARRLEAFGGEISFHNRSPREAPYRRHASAVELARHCDVLVVATSAQVDAPPLVDREVIEALGPTGVLVNIARGGLVDQPALIAALAEGRIGGAALDVFADEPNVPEALRQAPNVVLTPHIGSATVETRQAMADLILANLDAWLRGEALVTPVV